MYGDIVLNGILSECNELIWIKNCQLQYTQVSHTVADAFQMDKADIIGTTLRAENVLGYHDRVHDQEIIEKDIEVEDDELLLYKNSYQMLHVVRKPLKDNNGNIVGIIGIATPNFNSESAGHAFELIMEDIPYGIIVTNKEGKIVKGNNRLSDYLFVEDEIVGHSLEEFGLERKDTLEGSNAKLNVQEHTMKLFGKEYSFTVQRVPLHDFNGRTTGEVLLLSDMTDEFKRVRMQYNEKFSKVLKSAYSDIIEVDFEEKTAQCLTSCSQLFMLSEAFCDGEITDLGQIYRKVHSYVYNNDLELFETVFNKDRIRTYFAQNDGRMLEIELRMRMEKDNYSWLRFTVFQIKGSNNKVTYLYCVRDINEEKNAERDSLSMLYNRGAFVKTVEEHLASRKREAGCAFYMIDVDDFKAINDGYGHNIGDAVIQNIGGLLKDVFREIGVAGRMGGDEFAAYQREVHNAEELNKVAATLIDGVHHISEKLEMHSKVTISIGILYVTSGNVNFDTIYQKADEQLYWSKRNSKNRYRIATISF